MTRRRHLFLAFFLVVSLLAGACSSAQSPEAAPEPLRTDSGLKARAIEDRPPCKNLDQMVRRAKRGYYPFRSPDLVFIAREPNYVGTAAMPVHSGPWNYLTRVPLLAYGPRHIKSGTYSERATIADLAPTAAKLMRYRGWPDRDGRPLTEMLKRGATPPKLIVNMVWDGGGWNALDAHPDKWPYLKRLLSRGANYENFDIGSSPSVTPPIHTNLGTGSFPKTHGMASLKIRTRDWEHLDPFGRLDGSRMKVSTLADKYDVARGNKPVTGMLGSVSWHLGMIGHGSAFPGGDEDPVALLGKQTGVTTTNEDIYSVPDISDPDRALAFAKALDAKDGKRDGRWRGHPLQTHEQIHYTPATADYEEWLLERLVRYKRFGADRVSDLLYVNFKTSDIAGHKWGMNSTEVGEIFKAQDENLRRFVNFLDNRVGQGRWVLFLTADHGQMPYPRESGAWPIYGGELARDMNAVFDKTNDEINLISSVGAAGIYVRLDKLEANDASLWKMARWVAGYTIKENLKQGEQMPARFVGRGDELLMDAVLVKNKLAAVACNRGA